jgi:DNA modification methylase/ParB-like chromosome segregation protein Spo0J
MKVYHDNKPPELINIYAIDVEGIAREITGDIVGLATSILDIGLLHPLHVHKVEGAKVKIVSGSRRLTAYKYIYENWEIIDLTLRADKAKEYYLNIPVHIHEGLDEGTLLLIEYEENHSREDLTVFEVATLYTRMYQYWVSKEGLKISTSKDAPGMSHRKLASMLDISQATVSRFLQYNAMCIKFPELKVIKDANLLVRQFDYLNKAADQASKAKALATKIDDVKTNDKVTSPDSILMNILQSCMASSPGVVPTLASADTGINPTNSEQIRRDELYKLKLSRLSNSYMIAPYDPKLKPWDTGTIPMLAQLEPESVDFIDCDSPYGIALNEIYEKEHESTIDNYVDVAEDLFPEFARKLVAQLHRILKTDRRLIFWFHSKYYTHIYHILTEKFSVPSAPVIWNKGSGPCRNLEFSRAHVYDNFFECSKGVCRLYRQGVPNVLNYPRVQRNKLRSPHPAEHPIELMEDILSTYINPNWPIKKVLVPFLGSGNTILAAANLGAIAYGYDISTHYQTDFRARLDNGNRLYKSYISTT